MYQKDTKIQIYETGKKRPDQQKDKKTNLPERRKKSTRKTQRIYQKDIKVMINRSHTKKEDIYQKPKRPEVHNDRPDYYKSEEP